MFNGESPLNVGGQVNHKIVVKRSHLLTGWVD